MFPVRKIRWLITNNSKKSKAYKEHGYTTYECPVDNTWVNTEIPISTSERPTELSVGLGKTMLSSRTTLELLDSQWLKLSDLV